MQVTLLSSLACASPATAVSTIFTVSSSDTIDIGLGADTLLCDAGIFQLNATSGLSYLWSPTMGLNDPAIANPTATITQSITYQVLVTNAAGCSDSDSIAILLSVPSEILTNDTSLCISSVLQLDATPGGIYSWTPTSGLSDPNVANPSFTVAGDITYYLTVTNAEGCVNTDSVLIVSNPLPLILSNDTTVCNGTQLILEATPGGTYLWTPSSGLSNPAISNPTASLSGDVTYSLNVTSAEGCVNTDSIVLLTNPLPVILSNDTTVCVNATVQLNATPGGTYNWSPSLGLSNPAISNPTATVAIGTVYMLNATSAEGCNASDSVAVQTYQEPIITSLMDTIICAGACFVLSPTITTGVQTVNWSTSVGLSDSTLLNPSACPPGTMDYGVSIVDLNGCMATETINVVVNPLPAVPTITFNGVTLTSSASNAYQWYLNGAIIPGANTMIYTPTQNGPYTVEVTNAEGCSELSGVYVLSNLGIGEDDHGLFIVFYPNPVKDNFYVALQVDHAEEVGITVLDLRGKILKEKKVLTEQGMQSIEMHVEDLASGTYICRIHTAHGLRVVQFVVE